MRFDPLSGLGRIPKGAVPGRRWAGLSPGAGGRGCPRAPVGGTVPGRRWAGLSPGAGGRARWGGAVGFAPRVGVHPLQQVAGAPESALADADAARLPEGSAPSPWDTALDAVAWVHRAATAAREWLPRALRGRRLLPVTVGALISYRETPVGPYREVLGSPVLLAEWPLPSAVIPFIAVDSLASVHGGRANWQLPKSLARFEWPE